MTTTPTPVQRAAEAIEDNTGLNGIIDGEAVALAALTAALDVDEIARVLAEHSAVTNRSAIPSCRCGDKASEASWQRWGLHQAAALVGHLTGGAR